MLRTRQLAHLTWPEVSELARTPPVVLLPIGSLEQNGPACPLGTDAMIAEHFCERLAEMTDAVVAPAIPYGHSGAFRSFPGTVWLRPATMHDLVFEVCVGLANAGFTHILVVDNHGPNKAVIEAAARDAAEETGVVVGHMWPLRVMAQIAERSQTLLPGARGHGGEPMASVLKYISPEDLRLDEVSRDHPSQWGAFQVHNSHESSFEELPFALFVDMASVSDTGLTGDPTAACADAGRELVDEALEWARKALQAFSELRLVAGPEG
jgi:creatinine amidohydrolase